MTGDGGTRDRILAQLKRRGPHAAARLAELLDLTPTGVRQHLARLAEEGLVRSSPEESGGRPGRPGRPGRVWELTEEGARRFPESYADLALELVEGVRAAFGATGMEKLVAARLETQVAAYRALLDGKSKGRDLAKRVAALARRRSEEGYMAEWRRNRDGSLLLIENNCPICSVARACPGLCGAELELFRRALGEGVEVERTEHLLDGRRRCVYRIAPR